MEALILILLAAFAPLLMPLVKIFATLIGMALAILLLPLALELTGLVVGLVVGRWVERRFGIQPIRQDPLAPPIRITTPDTAADAWTPTSPPVPDVLRARSAPPRRRRWIRWILFSTSGLTAAMLLTLVVINLWFIDDAARWLLDKQRERSGIAITAEIIEGNLFSGKFQATGITVRRLDHPAGLIDLTVRRVETEISVWRVFADPLEVKSLTVDGVQGRFEHGLPGQAPVKKTKLTDAGGMRTEKRQFEINSLTITDVAVTYADHTRKKPLILPLTVTRLTAAPLHSQWAVFDVLFRANANGTVAGRPFSITTTGDDLGRDTQWHVDGLPVEVLAEQLGGPFALLSSGSCDVHVVDHWRMSGDHRVIVMDWSMVLNQVQAAVPEDLSAVMTLLAKPAVAFINSKGELVPLSFRVEIDENRFDGAASAEAAGLWKVVSDSAAAMLAKALGIETDSVKGAGGLLLDKAKEALDKWRKKKD